MSTTVIQCNKMNSPISTHSLVVQTSTNYQPKSICLKKNYVAAMYNKTWYTAIVQDSSSFELVVQTTAWLH